MIKLAMVSTERTRGGAARMAALLANSLNTNVNDLEISFFHCEDNTIDPPFFGLKRFASRQINAGLARLGGSNCVLDFGVADEIIRRTRDTDILHVHNLHGYYLDWQKLLHAWRNRPVVWTWHDQWGATGRCGFAIDCNEWQKGCPKCHHMDYYPSTLIDRAAREFQLKTTAYQEMKNMTVVSPSVWLGNIAIQRGLSKEQVVVVPNPVDLNVYTQRDKAECRSEHNIPADEFVALFIAADCNDVRKGHSDFVKICENLPIYPLAVGGMPSTIPKHIHYAGEIRQQAKLATYYAAADVMVFVSKADNYPNTVIESLVCGTPIIAYNVGGVSSQLDDIFSQLLPYGDIPAMRESLMTMKNLGGKTEQMQTQLTSYAQSIWADDVIAQKYLQVYKQAITK